ncbi:2385_t:CDS:2, partial [Dentiscutata heterogama]
MSLSPDNLILFEILDILTLTNNVEQFVINCIENKDKNIKIPKKHASLFVRIKNLINSIDAITSQVSLDRNSDKGPIKKYDIFSVSKDQKYDIEIMLSEISHGPLDETLIHSIEDRIKLRKEAKNSLDNEEGEDDEESENYESEDNRSNDKRKEDYKDNENKEDKENEHEELENETIE